MADLPVWVLALEVLLFEGGITILIILTRRLVRRLLAMVEPWLAMETNGDTPAVGPKVPVRDARGRIVRWERIPIGAAGGGGGGGAENLDVDGAIASLQRTGVGGVPDKVIQDLIASWSNGTLNRASFIDKAGPYLPQILGALRQEFMPRPGESSGGGDNSRSRWG